MSDKDIIRKAVELADGWEWDHDGFHRILTADGQTIGGQQARDALAVQLARQAACKTWGWERFNRHAAFEEAMTRGDSIGALTAIVESGVLEGDSDE